jgi:tyrosyl-tRNA synthetase
MALAVTASRHGDLAALQAQADAGNLVLRPDADGSSSAATAGGASVPDASLAAVNFPAKAFYLLSALGICTSSEARRQIQNGGVRLDGQKLTDVNQLFSDASELDGKVLQLGKKTFRRLVN